MKILDTLTSIVDGQLRVPFYHRGHLSFKSGTSVDICLIPTPRDAPVAAMPEVVVSPVHFASWRHLWRINAVFAERQGIVHRLLDIISEADLNVLIEESSSVQNRQFHEIEVIADARALRDGDPDGTLTEDEAVQAVERRILAFCVEHLAFRAERPRLKVRRMKGLYHAWRAYTEARGDNARSRALRERTTVLDKAITLPKEFRQQLGLPSSSRVLLVSDTKERLLRIFFPSPQQHFTYLRVKHYDTPGALSAITGELARAFDIITSLTRIHMHGQNNVLELLLYSDDLAAAEDEQARQSLINTLLTSADLESLNLRLSFPDEVAGHDDHGRPPERSGHHYIDREPLRGSPEYRHLSTSEVIRQKIDLLRKEERVEADIARNRQLQVRLNALKDAIIAEEGDPTALVEVFVSFPFGPSKRPPEVVTQRLEQEGWTVVDGANPNQGPVYREVIRRRIEKADAFVGVWTAAAGTGWLPWELGVAQALGKPYRLLISESIDRDLWIVNPEKFHYFFAEGELLEQLELLVHNLRDDLNKLRGGIDLPRWQALPVRSGVSWDLRS